MTSATQIRLKKRPEGLPTDDTWERTEDAPRSLEAGEIAVEVEFVSVDPAMRGWINVYFDNVGGQTLGQALARIAMRGRIIICGAISQYNNASNEPIAGPKNYMNLLVQRARMEGFVVFDYASRFPEAIMEMMGWVRDGKLILDKHIVAGIDNFPEALRMLFDGRNKGKLIIQVQ